MGLSPPHQPSPFKGEGVVVMIPFINPLSPGGEGQGEGDTIIY